MWFSGVRVIGVTACLHLATNSCWKQQKYKHYKTLLNSRRSNTGKGSILTSKSCTVRFSNCTLQILYTNQFFMNYSWENVAILLKFIILTLKNSNKILWYHDIIWRKLKLSNWKNLNNNATYTFFRQIPRGFALTNHLFKQRTW